MADNHGGLHKGLNIERKPKTGKGRRILKSRESKAFENPKGALILKGARASQEVTSWLQEIGKLKKPLCSLFTRTHAEHPFESMERIEKLCRQQDNSLFCLASTSKKRPFRVVFGRTFDHQLLDMQEFGVSGYKPPSHFKGVEPPAIGSKPLLVFQGAAFDHDPQLKQSKSLLMDFFRGAQPEKIALNGLDHVIVFSTLDQGPEALAAAASSSGDVKKEILFRHYRIALKKSGTKLPYVELSELGPSFTLSLDRVREPERGMWKIALKVPKQEKGKKIKNIKTNAIGERLGTIHVGKQDFNKIHTPHFHGKKGKKRGMAGGGDADADDEGPSAKRARQQQLGDDAEDE